MAEPRYRVVCNAHGELDWFCHECRCERYRPTAGPYSIGSEHWPGLSKLTEEMGELQRVLGKLIGTNGEADHWDGSDLRVRLEEELADVLAAMAFFVGANKLDRPGIDERSDRKTELFIQWHKEQG